MIQTDKMIEENKDRLSPPADRDALAMAAVAYIDAQIGEPIRLDDIAASLFVSKSTLCHKFANSVHMTTNRYITMKKIHKVFGKAKYLVEVWM